MFEDDDPQVVRVKGYLNETLEGWQADQVVMRELSGQRQEVLSKAGELATMVEDQHKLIDKMTTETHNAETLAAQSATNAEHLQHQLAMAQEEAERGRAAEALNVDLRRQLEHSEDRREKCRQRLKATKAELKGTQARVREQRHPGASTSSSSLLVRYIRLSIDLN